MKITQDVREYATELELDAGEAIEAGRRRNRRSSGARRGGGLGSHANATDPAERARLRFAHILSAFPLVAQETKDAAMVAYGAAAWNGISSA